MSDLNQSQSYRNMPKSVVQDIVVLSQDAGMDPLSVAQMQRWICECDDPDLAQSLRVVLHAFGGMDMSGSFENKRRSG